MYVEHFFTATNLPYYVPADYAQRWHHKNQLIYRIVYYTSNNNGKKIQSVQRILSYRRRRGGVGGAILKNELANDKHVRAMCTMQIDFYMCILYNVMQWLGRYMY